MANRRMIHKSISTSKQVHQMTEFAQLLFTWSIAHADDYGCLDGDPEVVMATVIPMKRDRTSQEVDAAIREWVENGLVWWYEVNGKAIIQFCTWDEHQTGLNKRTNPKYPLYIQVRTSENFREILRNSSLRELNRTELNRTEQNGKEENARGDPTSAFEEVCAAHVTDSTDSSSSLDLQFGQVVTLYGEAGFGDTNDLVREQLIDLCDTFTPQWVLEAIKESVFRNKRSMKYMNNILQNWRAEGGVRRSGGETNGRHPIYSRTITTERKPPSNEYRRDKPGAF